MDITISNLISGVPIFLSLLYFHRQSTTQINAMRQENAMDRQRVDDRLAKLDERFVKMNERWLHTEEKILEIMLELKMRPQHQNRTREA